MIRIPVGAKPLSTLSVPLPHRKRIDRNGVERVIVAAPDATPVAIWVTEAKLSSDPSIVAVSDPVQVPGITWVGTKLSGMPVPLADDPPTNDQLPSVMVNESTAPNPVSDPDMTNRLPLPAAT